MSGFEYRAKSASWYNDDVASPAADKDFFVAYFDLRI